jgi:hypothetical protein
MKALRIMPLLLLAAWASAQEKPYRQSSPLDKDYQSKVKNLLKVDEQRISETASFELYKEKESEDDGPEWNYAAIIRIGDSYAPVELGINHKVKVEDISAMDGTSEIIITTGCFSDAGCMEKTLIISIHQDRSFTITDFDQSALPPQVNELYETYGIQRSNYPESLYAKDLANIRKAGEFALVYDDYDEKSRKCFLTIQSFKKSTKGFMKGSFTKRISKTCAG